jgi:hypothetical protein
VEAEFFETNAGSLFVSFERSSEFVGLWGLWRGFCLEWGGERGSFDCIWREWREREDVSEADQTNARLGLLKRRVNLGTATIGMWFKFEPRWEGEAGWWTDFAIALNVSVMERWESRWWLRAKFGIVEIAEIFGSAGDIGFFAITPPTYSHSKKEKWTTWILKEK